MGVCLKYDVTPKVPGLKFEEVSFLLSYFSVFLFSFLHISLLKQRGQPAVVFSLCFGSATDGDTSNQSVLRSAGRTIFFTMSPFTISHMTMSPLTMSPFTMSPLPTNVKAHHSSTFVPTCGAAFTPSLRHSFTPSLLHSVTPSLRHSFTPSLLHSVTPSLRHS
eukprot:Selendium_serpulae@DN676_c0_g1_i1.p1